MAVPLTDAVLRASMRPFGTSIFSVMTRQAIEHGAVNLAQGFPDFDPPAALVDAARQALADGVHQYAPSQGDPLLRSAVARHAADRYGLRYDPDTEVTVTVGATEAVSATVAALTEPGDEVVLVEPCYDLYPPAVVAAGCRPVFVTTTFPDFRLDLDRLAAAVGPATRLIVLNTPTNPTGRLLSAAELRAVGELAERHDAWILADEAYEHLVYGDAAHLPVAAVAECADRTVTVSSISKTFSATGWRIGWALAPAPLTEAIRGTHQFVTFTAPAPLQRAAASMLDTAGSGDYYDRLRAEYQERRDTLLHHLARTSLEVAEPAGAFFVTTRCRGDDVAFCQDLVTRVGVAAVPASAFYYADRDAGSGLVRFAFCKRVETLRRAGELLRAATP